MLNRELARGSVDHFGEDVGAGQGGWPMGQQLKQVAGRMERAESALSALDLSGSASNAQQEAVSALDAMLAALQRECERLGGQGSIQGPSASTPGKPDGMPGANPAESGVASAEPGAAPGIAEITAHKAAIGELAKDLWGRLPKRQREELLQPLSEEFLPEYAADIEEYFRVLAESAVDPAETEP
jgi:hypothetical protein